MKRLIAAVTLVFAAVGVAQPVRNPSTPEGVTPVHRISRTDRSGTAVSVRVPDGPLVFTGQVFAADVSGDARSQAERALQALGVALMRAGSDLTRVARLNAYVADDQAIAGIEAAVGARFADAPPAFTLVKTSLAVTGALVAFEAVAMSSRTPSSVEITDPAFAILPAGGKIFISGQVERGPDLGRSAKLTMDGLNRSLAHLGLKKTDIVQVKAFIKPFNDHRAATREIAASFDGGPVPPIVIMEWVSDIFTEIELVASAGSLPSKADEPISYSWLPWLTRSSRYCNVAFVAAGTPLIFIGAIDGGDTSTPRQQMKTIFERLGSRLFEAGSSYRTMAKATYYLADPTARALLGDIRGVYFDPMRPPAASALNVNGLGVAGRAAMLDMIAVPVK